MVLFKALKELNKRHHLISFFSKDTEYNVWFYLIREAKS